MCIVVNYFKMGESWFLDLPEYLDKEGTSTEDLERIGSFREFLEIASRGKTKLSFELNDEHSDGADILTLSGNSGENSGLYYHIHQFQGKHIDLELWFNHVIYHFVDTPPERLYIKPVSIPY